MNIAQVNKVNRQINIPTLDRNASEDNDIRIEGKGESLRLPFLASFKQLLFQSSENLAFYSGRVNKANELGLDVNHFDSPVAIFNFWLPSYQLKFKTAKMLKEDKNLVDYGEQLTPSDDNPCFVFTYSNQGSYGAKSLLLSIFMQRDCCYMELFSGKDGTLVADSFLRNSFESKLKD
jgi:hypothetical protein